uniref:Enoyl-CoA hydratase/isomerase family protein n=1 Tax=Phenylobacterium glaciei TaxID=2803784 RepID=A0A974S7Y4_9CAUL|nr:enoyl-CoA hydratase/isomerase family protein [Phenylobacterium glaciei]
MNQTIAVEETAPGLLVVTLSRPEAANSLNTAMGRELLALWMRIIGDEQVRAVVLTGAGRFFCAGADLKERDGMTDAAWGAQHRLFEDMIRAQLACPFPVIAAVNGAAMGGGRRWRWPATSPGPRRRRGWGSRRPGWGSSGPGRHPAADPGGGRTAGGGIADERCARRCGRGSGGGDRQPGVRTRGASAQGAGARGPDRVEGAVVGAGLETGGAGRSRAAAGRGHGAGVGGLQPSLHHRRSAGGCGVFQPEADAELPGSSGRPGDGSGCRARRASAGVRSWRGQPR